MSLTTLVCRSGPIFDPLSAFGSKGRMRTRHPEIEEPCDNPTQAQASERQGARDCSGHARRTVDLFLVYSTIILETERFWTNVDVATYYTPNTLGVQNKCATAISAYYSM